MENAPMIRVSQLTIGWGSRVLMKDLTFDIERGERFVILGGSGSGKSTLLQTLFGLTPPLSGSMEIGGTGPIAPETRAPAYGVMFQSGELFGSMTLLDNVALPLQRWTELPSDAVGAIDRALLRMVGLEGVASHT